MSGFLFFPFCAFFSHEVFLSGGKPGCRLCVCSFLFAVHSHCSLICPGRREDTDTLRASRVYMSRPINTAIGFRKSEIML